VRKLVLKNTQSPGDIVMLTAAVRDLHRAHPGEFLVDVRTSCPDLWLNNPNLTALADDDPDVEVIECHYPLIHQSNRTPVHFLHGFPAFLNERLGVNIRVTDFKGDIHFGDLDRQWFETAEALDGPVAPFWLIVSGGKFDFTIKWWDPARYQQVVDEFRGRIAFVQVGEDSHHHPALDGVVDLRGKTTLRQLVRLMYRAEGVITPVSLLMHLAAAVETPAGRPKSRPCVVIAGGREPPHFTAYPHHQFIHRVGALPCSDQGGCWRSRTVALGDGDERDGPDHLCVNVVAGPLPRCMDMIAAREVIERVGLYFEGGLLAGRAAVAPAIAELAERLTLEIHGDLDDGLLQGAAARQGRMDVVGKENGEGAARDGQPRRDALVEEPDVLTVVESSRG
jgi:ADP-heptose:LPS heptosyltransferase